MDFIATLFWPLKWVIEALLVAFHALFTMLGMDTNGGWTWLLSIAGLVLVVRSALIPLFVRQIKGQREMMAITPLLKKIQDKYKGKRDQFSLMAAREEQQRLYREHGVSPFSSCFAMLPTAIVGLSLYQVIQEAQAEKAGVGSLTVELSRSFARSDVFGAPLSSVFAQQWTQLTSGQPYQLSVLLLLSGVVVIMVVTQFVTQFQIASKNISEEVKQSPMYRNQRVLLYVLPLVFAGSGVFFPLGVMLYWSVSNFWTMGQQWWVIRRMPMPGSEAARARETRLTRRGKLPSGPGSATGLATGSTETEQAPKQRQQPVSKARKKKKGGPKS